MHISEHKPNNPGVTQIDGAVIHAGERVLLALELRAGRHPVQLQSTGPQISWLCADGQIEFVDLSANQAEQERLAREVAQGGLLVAELDDITTDPLDAAFHWLLQDASGAPERTREHQ